MTLGPYTIREGLRRDNPHFPVYLVFRGDKLVGRQFSMPSLTDCEWLERHQHGRYAEPSALLPKTSKAKHVFSGGESTARRGRPTNAERDRREALLLTELSAD